MIAHRFDGGQNPLTDRNGGNDDDKLGEAIGFVQFKDRSQKDVGLSCARFHFNGKVRERVLVIRRNQLLRFVDEVLFLNLMEVRENGIGVCDFPMANSKFVLLNAHVFMTTKVNVGQAACRRESLEQIND